MTDKYRSRNFALLLYPEDETHLSAIKHLEEAGYNFACILHDQDTWSAEDPEFNPDKHIAGVKKKEHFHVVLKFQNPKWDTSLAKELGIKPNYIRDIKNLDKALLYLVHEGYPDKYQYDVDAVVGPLKITLQKLLLDEDEGSRVLRIVEMIKASPSPTYSEILIKSCKAGLYGEFRRLGCGVKYLIEDEMMERDAEKRRECDRYSLDHDLSCFNDRLKT